MRIRTNKCSLLLAIIVAAMTAGTINSKAGVQINGNVLTNSFNNGDYYFYQLIVGVSNSSASVVVNGGSVYNNGGVPDLLVGLGTTTNNSVTVTGTGSLWNCGLLYSGGAARF